MKAWIARQPICDASRRIVAYELLHRTADGTAGCGAQATAEVLFHGLFNLGLDKILRGMPALVNVPQEVLVDERLLLLPRESIGLEILEDTLPSAENLAACRRLQGSGFQLLLDDYEGQPHLGPFLDLVDSVKVEWPGSWRQHRDRLIRWKAQRGGSLIAEKLETMDEFREAVDLGFDQFQGYFLERPHRMAIQRVPANAPARLRLLGSLADPASELEDLIAMVMRDPELSLHMLKLANSARFARKIPAECVREAMAWMGDEECRRWLTVLLLPQLAPGIDPRLVMAMIVKAKFAESILRVREGEDLHGLTFVASLVSQLVGVIGIEQSVLFDQYRIPDSLVRRISQIHARDTSNEEARAVMLAESYYEGRWEECDRLCASSRLPPENLADIYLNAMDWAAETAQ